MGGANTVPPAFNIGGTIHLFLVCVFPKRLYLNGKHTKRIFERIEVQKIFIVLFYFLCYTCLNNII